MINFFSFFFLFFFSVGEISSTAGSFSAKQAFHCCHARRARALVSATTPEGKARLHTSGEGGRPGRLRLQYKVIKSGKEGALSSGRHAVRLPLQRHRPSTVRSSTRSHKRGQPSTFAPNQVIKVD